MRIIQSQHTRICCLPGMTPIKTAILRPHILGRWILSVYLLLGISWTRMEAQPYVSLDTPPSCYEIEARVRNGISSYEGVIYTPSTPSLQQPGGTKWQMNPSGIPVWNSNGNTYGDTHTFLFTYRPSTGKSVWNIDFNRDGDYSDYKESVTNVAPTLVGKGFQYINILGQGNDAGRIASVTHFTINGVDFGSYTSTNNTPFSILFEDLSGLFNEVTITGLFSFSGAGSAERPRIWIQLGESNIAPTCTLNSPLDGTVYATGSTIFLAATATDPLGKITKVEFYDGDTKIGEDVEYPYTLLWNNVPSGYRTLRAKSMDNHQAMTFSNLATVLMSSPPSISIFNPTDGFVFYDPDTIWIQAEIAGVNATNHMVEFFRDTVSIGMDSFPPYLNYSLINQVAGTYTVKAISTDPYGLMLISQPVGFSVRCIREDLDNNGTVNTIDFLILLGSFGMHCIACPTDLNDDGQVNTLDFLRVVAKFGYQCN